MFIKYSDKTEPISLDEGLEKLCKKCGFKVIKINQVETCECDDNHIYKKSKDFLQKKTISANSNS